MPEPVSLTLQGCIVCMGRGDRASVAAGHGDKTPGGWLRGRAAVPCGW